MYIDTKTKQRKRKQSYSFQIHKKIPVNTLAHTNKEELAKNILYAVFFSYFHCHFPHPANETHKFLHICCFSLWWAIKRNLKVIELTKIVGIEMKFICPNI